MENQSLTPKEIELHDKLNKVGERILWYFRTRESERTYLSLTHGRVSKSWWWLNLCANNAAKFTISYKEHEYAHDKEFDIKYNDDVILSGKAFVSLSEMSLYLYWNHWSPFVVIDLNKNTGERTNHFNDEPEYPDIVTQKDLFEILNIVSQELDITIVTAVQKKPEELKENELRDKLNKVGEMILQYFRTREYERLYMTKDHDLYGTTWIFSDLDNEVTTKIIISHEGITYANDPNEQIFKIKYNDDVILSGKVILSTGEMRLYWNNWCMFVTIDLNKNTGECTNYFNHEPRYPGLVDQKDLIKILNIVSQELGVLIVTAVQKKPEEPKEIALNEGATVNDVIGSDVLNKPTDHVFALHGRQVKLTECVAAPSRYGLIDPKTKQVNEVAHLIYRAFVYAIDEIAKEDNVPISHMPAIQEITWEWLFAYKNHDGDICIACTEHIMRGNVDHYELWYRDPKGIKHVFMRLVVDNPGHITVYEGDRTAVTHVSARAKVKVKALVDEYNNQKKPEEPEELKEIAKEHDKEVLSDFCNALKEFSEEYADSWLINKFNKLIGVLKNYCFNINQIYRHKRLNAISWDLCYMLNHNLLPPVTMIGDRYSYDYNPTSFKIFDMYDSNGDLMVKVDHETFEINFYFYHSATEPFLTISANDYMGHVKQSYHDSHLHMDEFRFKYLTELIEKELKIQIMNPFVDPVIIDDTWKDTNPVSEIIEGSSVVNDTWKNPDPINTTNFKGVKKMTFAKLRTIVLSWISQNIMGDKRYSTVETSHDVPGVPIKITVTVEGIKKDLFINFNEDQTEFIIYEGFFGFPNKVITIKSDEKTNSQDVEFNNRCAFTHFPVERMLSLYNTICTEMGKESNDASTFTPPSVANVVNRYGNMSVSPRYEVKNSYQSTDGSTVITGLKLLGMNIVKPRNRDFTGEWVRIIPRIKSILFNEKKKVTTVIWNDDTKTMAKCTADDDYDEEIGVAICIAKKYYDNNQNQMRKEINKFKARQKKHADAVQKRLDKKNKVTEIIDNKPNEIKVDDNTDNIIG